MSSLGNGMDSVGNKLASAASAPQTGGGGSWLSNIFSSFGGLGPAGINPGGLADLLSPTWFNVGKGDAFQMGQPMHFGKGDVFSGPTSFNMPGGKTGQLGEVPGQEEAVMPLHRDGNGQLGIKAKIPRGDGSGNVIINIMTPEGTSAKTKKSTNSGGDTIVDVLIEQAKQSIANDIVKGGTTMNTAIEGRYALKSAAGIK